MSRKRVADIVLACIALALVIVFAVLRSMQPQAQYSQPSTYDTGGNGYAALFDLLARERVPVRRFQEPLGQFRQHGGALVLAGDDAVSAAATSANALDALDKWVRGGGTLFVLGATSQTERRALGMPNFAQMPKALVANAGCGLPKPHRSLRAGAEFTAGFARGCTVQRVTLLRAANKAVMIAYRHGKGRVITSVTAAIFGNAQLVQHDNAALAYAVFAVAAPVAFDERIYGYATGRTFWQVLPWGMRIAVVLACIAIVLAIAGANLPFAPPASREPPGERDSGAYIASLARMLRRGGAAREMIVRLQRHADAVLASRAGSDDRAHALREQLQRLASHSHPGPRELLAAGRIFATVQKEYEW